MVRGKMLSACVAALAALAPLAAGQAPAVRVDDRGFVKQASEVNAAEVEFGRLALQRAGREDVKRFAKELVTDHTHSAASLDRVAGQLNLPVKAEPSAAHRDTLHKLAELRGGDFDRAFLAAMVKGHEKAVELYSAEAAHGQAPAVRRYAFESLPTLRGHLRSARELLARLEAAARR